MSNGRLWCGFWLLALMPLVGCSPEELETTGGPPLLAWGKADGSFPTVLEAFDPEQLHGELAAATPARLDVLPQAPLQAYSFTGTQGDVLLATVLPTDPSGATAAVALVDDSLTVLAASKPAAPGLLRAPLPASGRYYLAIAVAGGSAASLEVQWNTLTPVAPAASRVAWEPPAPGVAQLTALFALSADEVWAAGHEGVVLHHSPAGLERFDLRLRGTNAWGIWAPSSEQAFALFSGKLLILEKGAWYQLTTKPGQTTFKLDGSPTGELWALSRAFCDGLWCSQGEVVTSRWDGQRWRHHTSALLSKNWYFPHALGVSGDEAWVFGRKNSSYESVAAERYNGLDWVAAGNLPSSIDITIESASAVAAGGLLVVGSSRKRNYAAAWDGAAWSALNLPCDSGGVCVSTELAGIWGASLDDIWITGKRQAYITVKKQNIFRRAAGVWSQFTAPYGLAVHGAGDVPWFAGPGGYLARYGGGPDLEQVTQPVRSCAGFALRPSGAAIAACGTELLAQQGSGWSRHPVISLSTDEQLTGAWAESESTTWLITSAGRVLRKDALSERQVAAFGGSRLVSISGSSAADVWIGSAQGSVARWDGQAFSPVSGLAASGAATVIALSGQRVLVLTSDGLHVLEDGAWVRHDFASPPRALCAAGPDTTWVASDETLHRWDGAVWTAHQPQPTASKATRFAAVACLAGGGVLAYGQRDHELYLFDGAKWQVTDRPPWGVNALQALTGGGALLATDVGVLRFE